MSSQKVPEVGQDVTSFTTQRIQCASTAILTTDAKIFSGFFEDKTCVVIVKFREVFVVIICRRCSCTTKEAAHVSLNSPRYLVVIRLFCLHLIRVF